MAEGPDSSTASTGGNPDLELEKVRLEAELRREQMRADVRKVVYGTMIVGLAAAVFPFLQELARSIFTERIEGIKTASEQRILELKTQSEQRVLETKNLLEKQLEEKKHELELNKQEASDVGARRDYLEKLAREARSERIETQIIAAEFFSFLAEPKMQPQWQAFRDYLKDKQIDLNKEKTELLAKATSSEASSAVLERLQQIDRIQNPAPAVQRRSLSSSRTLAEIGPEYERLFREMTISPERKIAVDRIVQSLVSSKPRYDVIQAQTGVPWYFAGIVHYLESSFNFNVHLHNGDVLSQRTVRVPVGRPAQGEPPFTWEASAADFLGLKGLKGVDWDSLASVLYQFEAMNGFGYRMQGVPTPYVWGCTSVYTRGRYVASGVFMPDAVSQQCGAAAVIRGLAEQKYLEIKAEGDALQIAAGSK